MADTAMIFSDVCAREFLVTGLIFAGLAVMKFLAVSRRRHNSGGQV
jgi:hypothetical protein